MTDRVQRQRRLTGLIAGGLTVAAVVWLLAGWAIGAGVVDAPEFVGLTGPSVLSLTGLGFAALAAVAYYKHRRVRQTLQAGGRPDPAWTWHGRRAAAALVVGYVAVGVLGLAAKTVIESTSSATYTIHWIETVPLLALAFAWIVHGEWNRRALDGEEE